MELDNIKAAWTDLNKQLENAEMLNKRLLSELLTSRQQSTKDKLMRYEVCVLILCTFFAGITPTLFFMGVYTLPLTIIFEAVFLFAGLWQVYKIYLLKQMRLDQCSTTELLQKAIRFKMLTRMRTIVGLSLIIPLFIIISLFDDTFFDVYMHGSMLIGGIVGLSVGLFFFSRKLKRVDKLISSYKAIRDFEREE